MLCARALLAAAGLALLHPARPSAEEPALPTYNADIAQTSISGLSSGAFMAVQFGTAWSSIVIGVGAIAGGPFGCSEGSEATALSTCTGGAPAADVASLISRADVWARNGAIDGTANLARQRIYLFNGYNDAVVTRPVSDALYAFYAHYRPGSLFYQTAIGAGHAQVTVAYGGNCGETGGEYINRCGYDQAGIILQQIYGALNKRNDGTSDGRVIPFRQGDFTGSRTPIEVSLDDRGFVYMPAACEAREPCRVHVALHGCLQSFGDIGEDFVRHAGYNEWADTNRIIVLYPQVHAVDFTRLGITNPRSCWDWWGYLDADPTQSPTYLLKTGQQIAAIKAMVDRITGGAATSAAAVASTPAPPSTVLAIDASDSAIDLAWTLVPGAVSYDVVRSIDAGQTFRQLATVVGPSYGDAGLKPATTYRYRVRASFGATKSDFSAIVSRQTRRKVPPCMEPGSCPVR
jgi:hypothetical protein